LLHLKENTIRRKVDKLKTRLSKKQIIVKPARKIAVLNNPQSNLTFDNLKFLQKTYGLSSSQFNIFTFKEKNDHYNELRGIVASKDVFNAFGKLKSPEIIEFLDKKYDLLLDFTNLSNIYEQYFSLSIQANCRIGYYHDEQLYDLMLNISLGDIKNYALESVKYLRVLGIL